MSWLGIICRCYRKRALCHMVDTVRAEVLRVRAACVALYIQPLVVAIRRHCRKAQCRRIGRLALQRVQRVPSSMLQPMTNAAEPQTIHSSRLK